MRTASTWAVAVVLALGVSGVASAQRGPGSAPAAAAPAPSAHVEFSNLNFHQGAASSGKTATHTTHSDATAHIGGTARQHQSTQGSDNGRGSGALGSVTANASYGGYNYPLGAIDFGNSAADQDLAIKALIDPVTEARVALAAREAGYARGTSFVPVYWGAGGRLLFSGFLRPTGRVERPTNEPAMGTTAAAPDHRSATILAGREQRRGSRTRAGTAA
jgi:hypothetical protein